MYLETERKLYTLAIGALALSILLVLLTRVQLISREIVVALVRSIGSGTAVAIGETILLQLLTALICAVPLKLTRNRLSAFDCLLLGGAAMAPTLMSSACEPLGWSWLTIATAPLLFMLVFRALQNVPPSSWLDAFYSDQKPWVSIAFAGMFALQISLMFILTAGKGTIFKLSILLALAGAVLAMLARRFDRRLLSIAAAAVFAYNLAVYVKVWLKYPGLTAFSCSDA
ncbi:hypothetical protein GCM10011487_06570 [Steroidobacter agaridevorans]|uniref:Uncharacterized protein n=2 Tax=Steroidobacter agaridevorans TaxID=2695856 RepID=A0A829Y614_9GAMM|nr:hypothetical protein GCM10011487_06570 [Steroidobacter agaridevorans]